LRFLVSIHGNYCEGYSNCAPAKKDETTATGSGIPVASGKTIMRHPRLLL
jgi:hypothetical protein